MNSSGTLRTLEATTVLLFLAQAVRVLFSVLFGIIYDVVFDQELAVGTLVLVMLAVVAAFLAPLAAPRRHRRASLLASAIVAALARVPLTINSPTVRLWSSIPIIAAAGMYTATLLRQHPRLFPTALLLAFAGDQFLRAAGSTYDVGLRGWWLPAQVVLSLTASAVSWLAFSRSEGRSPAREGITILGGLAIGALLFLETSLLGFPNALARWTGVPYAVVAPLLMLVTLLPLMPGARQGRQQMFSGRWSAVVWAVVALFSIATANDELGILYILSLVLFVQYPLLVALFCVITKHERDRTGLALGLGMLIFLLLSFALAFAFTYPYTIPAFRQAGRYVFMAAAVLAYIPALRPAAPWPKDRSAGRERWRWLPVAAAVLLTAVFAWPPRFTPKETGPIRVATYNIHYGYNTTWQVSLEEQARTIEGSGADIVMLQEVDACRITSYGTDDGLWLARRLGMREVYGPALEGLSGIALLTRFPITEADTQLLTSELEQTAIVHARVSVGGEPLDAYGVWLGLEPEERARQLDDALAIIGGISPVVLAGDFNATPDSPIYARVQATGSEDPFAVGGFQPDPTSPAIDPVHRIDYIWARGLEVRGAQVLDSLASDHRCVVVELELP